jgi:hypothetical protein
MNLEKRAGLLFFQWNIHLYGECGKHSLRVAFFIDLRCLAAEKRVFQD